MMLKSQCIQCSVHHSHHCIVCATGAHLGLCAFLGTRGVAGGVVPRVAQVEAPERAPESPPLTPPSIRTGEPTVDDSPNTPPPPSLSDERYFSRWLSSALRMLKKSPYSPLSPVYLAMFPEMERELEIHWARGSSAAAGSSAMHAAMPPPAAGSSMMRPRPAAESPHSPDSPAHTRARLTYD